MSSFNTRFNHSSYSGFHFNRPTLTEKQYGYDLDMNAIVERYQKGQYVPTPITNLKPIYGTSFEPNQFENAITYIRNATNEFNNLPAKIREKFDNDPNKMLNFISDEKNTEEAYQLGLLDEFKYQAYLDKNKPVIDSGVTVPTDKQPINGV